jgi:hypothetical protein
MKTELEGTLVRFDRAGVGVIDVEAKPQYVYFTPRQIVGYRGETIDELSSRGTGNWANGSTVVIQADIDKTGNVHVESVTLK